MKYTRVIVNHLGGPDALQIVEEECPEPKSGEVRVRVVYSIQRLKRRRPEWFRQDLMILFDLLQQRKISPLIARRFPLSGARDAQELLGKGGVNGKIVLLCSNSSRSEEM